MRAIRRPDLILFLAVSIALALIIGCGGGGGGGGGGTNTGSGSGSGSGSGTATGGTTSTTSTTGSTTSTTSTTGSTTSTTGSTSSTTGSTTSTTGSTTSTTGSTTSTTGSTTSTTGSTTGSTTTGGGNGYQPDRIYYILGLGGSGYQIRSVQPNGSDDQLFVQHAFSIPALVPNVQGTKYAFFSLNSGSTTKYDVYTNTSPTLAGATRITSKSFIYTGTIQFTPDGSQIIFTATTSEGDFRLYRVSSSGGTPVDMGSAEEATISPDGTTILYSKLQGGANPAADLFTVAATATNTSSALQLTATSADERNPQWSKDGTFIVFATDLDGNYNIYRMSSAGGSQVQITNSGLDEYGPSLNGAGTQVSFSIIDPINGVDDQGLYRCDINGANRATLKLGNVQTYTYWAPGSGGSSRAPGGGFFGMAGARRPPLR